MELDEAFLLKLISPVAIKIIDKLLVPDPTPLVIPESNQPAFVGGLVALYATAMREHAVRSQARRENLDGCLEALYKSLKLLRRQLASPNTIEAIGEPLRLAALDLFSQQKAQKRKNIDNAPHDVTNGEGIIRPSEILVSIEEPLEALEQTISHLYSLIDAFDGSADLDHWPLSAQEESGHEARRALIPYLRKGSQSEQTVTTTVLKGIVQLYQLTFDKSFSANPISPARRHELDNRRDKMRKEREARADPNEYVPLYEEIGGYEGPSVRFACAVIEGLGIQRLIVPLEEADLRQKARQGDPEIDVTQFDLDQLNREFAFSGRHVPIDKLINKIGSFWSNERKRISRAEKAAQRA